MHLEDINIEGFKSFSEKTDMSFQPDINVIIGNNGVGKSNILDAIVWALGEDSLEHIRCYAPQELFFSGSKTYPPADTIRVELNFKSGDGKDAPASQVTRELTRDGQARYLLQGKAVSRQAYRRQLKKLGLGRALETIIRQERINDILLASPGVRFDMVRTLLGIESADTLSDCLMNTIAPVFEHYMSYLMPLGEVRLDLAAHNGHPGFDIEATLPGNRVRRAHQLSGGEKSITSLALKMALFQQLPSPFFLLDEVEPSLDYTNHKAMQAFLKDVATDKQLIMITHLRSTIELANTVHGVRTRFDGSSFMKFYFVMDERLLMLYKCC